MDRGHRRFESHTPVSIEMPDNLIEELPRDVSRLASLVLHSAGKQPRPRRLTALISLYLIVPGASQCSSVLLPDRFIVQDARRVWRRVEPRIPMRNQGRPHEW